ncbi:MAG: phage tail assembly protein [Betaproteobacteria bacterium]|nr:phage tail assembly protein [Betaproteobacteria bacterium]
MQEQEITLEYPISRGDTLVEKITLFKPDGSGWLRGIKLLDLLQADTDALTIVLQRTTTPALTEHEIRVKLDSYDLMQAANVVASFFTKKSNDENGESPPA